MVPLINIKSSLAWSHNSPWFLKQPATRRHWQCWPQCLTLEFASVVGGAEQDSESSKAGKVTAVIVDEVIGVQDFLVATEHNPARRNERKVLSLLLSGYALLGEVLILS